MLVRAERWLLVDGYAQVVQQTRSGLIDLFSTSAEFTCCKFVLTTEHDEQIPDTWE